MRFKEFIGDTKTIRDHMSDDVLGEFLKQLRWTKDQLFGDTYRDVVKTDQIINTKIKIKKGWINGKFFVNILQEFPDFEFDNHHYTLRLSNFTRETIPPRKFTNKFPGFHVRKILAQVKEAV